MDRRQPTKGIAAGAFAAEALPAGSLFAQATTPTPQSSAYLSTREHVAEERRSSLLIADPQEWYSSAGYHHDSASHTLATVERLGRETGLWTTIIRTDMHLLTKEEILGANVRTLNHFDAVFYMGEGPWNITDRQKADLLSFVHEDGKGFIAGHAGKWWPSTAFRWSKPR